MITSDTDASLKWCLTPPLWRIDAVGGRPPHHKSAFCKCGQINVRFAPILLKKSAVSSPKKLAMYKRLLRLTLISAPNRFAALPIQLRADDEDPHAHI